MSEVPTSAFVFISYSRTDSEFVMHLETDLNTHGIQTWIDREGLQPGTPDWEEALRTAIRASQALLLIASPNARSSRYVKDELRIAQMYQRPIYPIWVAGAEWMEAVPIGWGGTQYIDAREAHYQSAVREILTVLSKLPSQTPSIPPKTPKLDFAPRNPYKGLRPFSSADIADFFGRDTLIHELAQALQASLNAEKKSNQNTRLLAVVGPSGSGKSSVVMAGLLPRLQAGELPELPGTKEWVYVDPLVPGAHPVESLMVALSRKLGERSLKAIREDLDDESARGLHLLATSLTKSQEAKVVLFVDQFEELFTQTISEEERQHFIDLLVTAITEPRGPLILLLTLRADFSDRPMHYPELGQLIERHRQPVFPMELDDLRATIEQPAALPDVGLTFEGNLVGDLLFEMQGQVGALPLLEFTLEQLFELRSDHCLTLSAYREVGGVKGALAQHAEKTYAALPSEEHRRLARVLFLRLIDLGTTEQDVTRRRAAFSELSLPDATITRSLRETADAFIAARLLTTNEIAGSITIEVSHEAVIREWRRLTDWIREAHEDLQLWREVREDAAAWKRSGQSPDRLYRGTQLAEALAWRERSLLSLEEESFLEAGKSEQERQEALTTAHQQQEALQRRRYTRRTVLVGLAGVGLATVAATVSRILFLRNEPSSPPTLLTYRGHTNVVDSVAWSPDGKRLASASEDQNVQVWDASNGHTLLTYIGHDDYVNSVAWSPDGKRLASASDDYTVQVWNANSGHTLLTYNRHSDYVNNAAWSPDGKRLASASDDYTVQVWDANNGHTLLTYNRHSDYVTSVTWSPDGKRLASGSDDYTVQVWNANNGHTLLTYTGHASSVNSVAWSPDGKRLASGSDDRTVRVWDASSGHTLLTYTGHNNTVNSVVWSPDGKHLASASNDASVQVWDASNGHTLLTYTGHTGPVNSVTWSPDGKRLASGSNDKTVQVWGASSA